MGVEKGPSRTPQRPPQGPLKEVRKNREGPSCALVAARFCLGKRTGGRTWRSHHQRQVSIRAKDPEFSVARKGQGRKIAPSLKCAGRSMMHFASWHCTAGRSSLRFVLSRAEHSSEASITHEPTAP